MSKNITLIDADSICYLGNKDDTLPQILEKVDYKINEILKETKADYYGLFISKGKYFRHDLKDKTESTGSYKANRTYKGQEYSKTIKEYLIAQYSAIWMPKVEADDLVAYWMINPFKYYEADIGENIQKAFMLESTYLKDEEINKQLKIFTTKYETPNITLASVDKDLLQSIKGRHLNYNKKTGSDTWEMVWIETTQEEADEFVWKQMIIGDVSDGIKGIPGKGKAYYEKLFQKELKPVEDIHEFILTEYVKYFGVSQGIYEFQKNYRLLHMLDCNEDFMREVGYTPELPEFREVIKTEEPEVKFD